MTTEVPIAAGMAETATSNVEASRFGDHTRDDKDGNQGVQNQQSAAIEEPAKNSQPTENFEPGKVES